MMLTRLPRWTAKLRRYLDQTVLRVLGQPLACFIYDDFFLPLLCTITESWIFYPQLVFLSLINFQKAEWVSLAEVESVLKQSKASKFIATSFRSNQENNFELYDINLRQKLKKTGCSKASHILPRNLNCIFATFGICSLESWTTWKH